MKALRCGVERALAAEGRTIGNAGLALDRYLSEMGKPEARTELYARVIAAPIPDIYAEAYARWERTLTARHAPARGVYLCAESFTVQGRLIVGLGAERVREAAITLHPLYGMPFIPAPALKGLARHYVTSALMPDTERDMQLKTLFGATDEAGFITFCDAWYVPGSAEGCPLIRDTITTHHPTYYTGTTRTAPSDFDDPNPTAFLSARGMYHVALFGPNEQWATFALDILRAALAEWGVGGKTSSGYGRLAPEVSSIEPHVVEPLVVEIQGLRRSDVFTESQKYFQRALAAPEPVRLHALHALRARLRDEKILDQAKWQKKEWVIALLDELEHDPPL